ncbi:MAG: response regulator transcription factor [Betaproteobacteria bacterium]|nr:response regulator transcription factor [Betaproteobacteria bacterium]MBL8532876.1 response regulator transcription factor [Betaproteobacteria bacterium]
MTDKTTVLLVDDHAVVLEGYRRLLERTPDIAVVAEASNGDDAYRRFVELSPDVVVMDITLPGIGGIEVARRMLARRPDARIVMFSMHEDVVFSSRALQTGARGYVTKSSAPDVLVEAVRLVAAGKLYISHDMAQELAVQMLPGNENPLQALSPREFEVFRLLVGGHSVGEIAKILSLSYKTVANHQWNIRQKLDVSNTAQVVRMAMTHGVIDANPEATVLADK